MGRKIRKLIKYLTIFICSFWHVAEKLSAWLWWTRIYPPNFWNLCYTQEVYLRFFIWLYLPQYFMYLFELQISNKTINMYKSRPLEFYTNAKYQKKKNNVHEFFQWNCWSNMGLIKKKRKLYIINEARL